jgi:hypothetical protein
MLDILPVAAAGAGIGVMLLVVFVQQENLRTKMTRLYGFLF